VIPTLLQIGFILFMTPLLMSPFLLIVGPFLAVAPTYLTGKAGAVMVDTAVQPITGWKGKINVGTFDATNSTTGGFGFPERTIKTMNGTFDVVWKVTLGQPSFVTGLVYALVLTAQTGSTYTFNALITDCDIGVEVKGGVLYSVSYMSQGAIVEAAA